MEGFSELREREERARNRRAQNEMTGSLSSEGTRGADSKTTRGLSSEGTQVVQEHQMIGSLSSGKAQGAQTESPSRGEKRQAQEQRSDRTGGLSGAAMKRALENASGRTESRSSGKAPTAQEHMSGRDRRLSSGETQSPKHASRRTKSHREESAPEDRKPMGGETEPSLGTPEDNQMKLTEGKKSRQAVEVTLQTSQGVQSEEQHHLAATFPIREDDPRRVSGRDLQRARGGSEDLRKTTTDAEIWEEGSTAEEGELAMQTPTKNLLSEEGKTAKSGKESTDGEEQVADEHLNKEDNFASVPVVRVRLLQSVRVLPHQTRSVLVQVDAESCKGPLLLEYQSDVEEATGLQVEDALLSPAKGGVSQLVVANRSGFTQVAQEGADLGEATEVTLITSGECPICLSAPYVEDANGS